MVCFLGFAQQRTISKQSTGIDHSADESQSEARFCNSLSNSSLALWNLLSQEARALAFYLKTQKLTGDRLNRFYLIFVVYFDPLGLFLISKFQLYPYLHHIRVFLRLSFVAPQLPFSSTNNSLSFLTSCLCPSPSLRSVSSLKIGVPTSFQRKIIN